MERWIFISVPVILEEKFSNNDKFEMADERAYKSLIDCFLYLTTTRPKIMYAVGMLSRLMQCYNTSHFKATKRVLRYIKGSANLDV